MKRFFTTILWTSCALITSAQKSVIQQTEMADLMRSNGKIYVVVAVMLTLLVGLVIYLIRLDKKLAILEIEMLQYTREDEMNTADTSTE